MHVFLGITGASGAPYAARLLEALAEADCEIGLCASRAGVEVLATELYGDARLSYDETVARLTEPVREAVTLYDERDWHAPYASGSAKVDAYVICPCSMGTLGTIASGAMTNLIQRAASVALKEERKLVLCPRETPLSLIHLENMTAGEAGGGDAPLPRAGLLPRSRVGGRPRRLHRRTLPRPTRARPRRRAPLGTGMTTQAGRLPAEGVRAMFDRIAPVYDAMNHVMTAGLDRRWRAETAAAVVSPGDRVLDACCGTGDLALASLRAGGRVTGLDFSERMLARARKKSSQVEWVQGDALALPFGDDSFDAATVGFGVRNLADLEGGLVELKRVLRPGGRVAVLEITQPKGRLAPFYRVWFDRIVPLLGKVLPGGGAYTYLPASVRRFPGPEDLAAVMRSAGFGEVRYRLFAGGIVALHTGVSE